PNYQGSTSTAFGLNVGQVGTTTGISTNTATAVFGQAQVTATVTPANAGAGNAPGSVTFVIVSGTTSRNVSAPLVNNVAKLDPTVLDAGSYTITAKYAGDSNFAGSSSTTSVTENVTAAGTNLRLTPSTNGPVTFGTPVTFTAAVTTQQPGTGTPAGSVTFTI